MQILLTKKKKQKKTVVVFAYHLNTVINVNLLIVRKRSLEISYFKLTGKHRILHNNKKN